eukprot:CAMPEP_0168552008 /NCGR_PEP_ID=MMETSP0413-20121227/6486_1 /TAXON_ID=136452 /ORGANISM="Filamoeba nolandi, Strain NC-AS-23-1" /LENGTH=891 /DNA_ID=CAMNT_0008582591 /DNA_START=81 /DNA_END=2756 /DNA_ORIENTATION=+
MATENDPSVTETTSVQVIQVNETHEEKSLQDDTTQNGTLHQDVSKHEAQPISSEDTATPITQNPESSHNNGIEPSNSQPAQELSTQASDTSTSTEQLSSSANAEEQSVPESNTNNETQGGTKPAYHRLEEISKRSLLTQSDDILERRSKDDSSLEDRSSSESNEPGSDPLTRRSNMRRTSTISGSLPSREEIAPKVEAKWKTYRREFRDLTSSGTVIGTRKPSMVDLSLGNNNNNTKSPVKQQPKGRMIELKVDALVGGVHGVVSKQFSSNMSIADVVKSILKRFPQTDEKYVIYLPIENPDDEAEESDGMWLDENKKLGDYDDQFLKSVFELKRLSEVSGPKKNKNRTLRGTRKIKGPNPRTFLADPTSKITVNEMPSDSIEVTFSYNQASSAGQWSKPDKEGELLKQGYFLKSVWSNRWVIMQNKQIFCFKQKPTSENDTPTTTINLEGGWYGPGETTHIKSQRVFSFEVFEIENNSKKKFCFATNTKEECEQWMNAVRNSIHSLSVAFDPNPVQSQSSMTVQISYGNLTGYIGLPSEWKQALRSCGITERYFYSFPDKALKMLRSHFNTNSIEDNNSESAPIVVHPLPESKESFLEDVVNRTDNPELIYTNFQLIGSGTFGEVYLATNVRSNQVVAIKKMLLTPKREPLFISEISVQKHSEHPNVLKLFEAYKVEDHLWVALEYMEHGNLYELLAGMEMARRTFTEPHIAYIVTETLKALSYIHGMHRIHRDIKSDNILIGANAEIKLADFGYAVQLATEEEKRGTICGSPFWMAPEIILGQKYGKTVDIWSLGILLIECCDLQPPYITEAPSKALILISTQPPPNLSAPDRWSKELKHFLSLCLQRDADLRPQAIELLRHPFLLNTCSAREFKEQVLDKRPPRPQQQ